LPPQTDDDFAKFYAKKGFSTTDMWAMDDSGNVTQLTSHKDPREIATATSTSFGDPRIVLPFSFHHENRLLAKGAVVDMAALVRDVEALTGKRYTTVYDLPAPSTEELLDHYPRIEIPIEEAWEEVEVRAPETKTVYRYDLDAERIYSVEVPTGEPSQVGTGTTKRQLKPGVRFDEATGKFYRRPRPEEIPAGATPNLPQWIVDRLPQN